MSSFGRSQLCNSPARKIALFGSSAILLSLVLAGSAQAQDTTASQQSSQAPEIVVTGSRIVRRDYTSDSPLMTISSQSLQNSSEVSIDQSLSQLPQFGAGANQITSAADIQATPTNSPGIATVNLRGLGTNRTLVLIDGRRTQPNNASLVVDLNTIPTAAIDSVEVITGGAGATYGADAVAGVVNFKLKHNYTGVTLDAQTGETFQSDGAQSKVSLLLGSNFDDNKGNAIVDLSYSKRDPVFFRNRSFFRDSFTDPGTTGTAPIPDFPGFASGGETQTALDNVFVGKGMGYQPGDVSTRSTLYFNTAPTTSGGTLFSVTPGLVSGLPAPGYTGSLYPNNKYLTNGTLSSNATKALLSIPLERYSMFTSAHYDVNDNMTVYVQANFDENQTTATLGNSVSAFNQWSAQIPVDSAHPVPAELASILASRTNATAPWTLYNSLDYLGPESITTNTNTYEMLAGVKGNIGIKDWTYDLFGSHGSTGQITHYYGFGDLAKYQTLIASPNYGAGLDYNNGRTGVLAHCTSGINPFVNTPVSQDCVDLIESKAHATTDLKQDQFELDIQGSLFEVPAGDLRFAVGADWRRNDFAYEPDPGFSTTNVAPVVLPTNPLSVGPYQNLVMGLFDVSPTSGEVAVAEGYAELLIPVLKDLPFVKSLNLDAGYRYSSYSTATGGVSTWKVTGDWDVNDWVRLRGGYQVANRAPNVAELFQPATYIVVPWPDDDPCKSAFTRAPYGNVPSNPNQAQVQALCSALSSGYTPFDSTFLGNVPAYFPLGRDLQRGNPNLNTEDAKTWTVGTVLKSPFQEGALRQLTLTIDYYDITIDNAIAPSTTQVDYQECFNGFGTNPTYDPNNPFCQLIHRLPNGFWLYTDAPYNNLGSIATSGIDTQLNWNSDAPGLFNAPGAVFANVTFNWLEKYDVQVVAGAPAIHYADTIGAPITSPPYGAQFRWKLYTTIGYTVGPVTMTLDWRHLPSVKNVVYATNPATTALDTGSYDQVDLSGRWSITSKYELRAGIDNLFDTDPNRVGATPGVTNAAGVTDPSGSYDVLGRRFYVGVTARF